ncbi:MAG: flippase-like domain-containing protein [Candidatus Aenigmarchaeota archaeon]|nr:flippase-like domain-containing protein [Candidatus Aenigmarchaeota archaeon]
MRISKLLPLIGIAIFIYLLLNIDLPKVADILLRTSILFFSVAIVITLVDIVLKAFKWQLIFNSYSIPVKFSRFLSSWIVGLSLSMITPGKVGDFAKAYYLRDKAPLGKGLTTVMADRIIDLLTLFVLAIIGLSIFATMYTQDNALLITTYALFAAFVLVIIIFSKKSIASAILRPFYRRLVPEKKKEKLKSIYNDFYAGIGLILGKKKLLTVVVLITFLIWFGTIMVIYFISLSLGFEIPLHFLLIVIPIITLLEALPISFSGVGTRDATMIFFFGFIGISAEASVSISLLYLLTSYIFVFIGFLIWYKNPIQRS